MNSIIICIIITFSIVYIWDVVNFPEEFVNRIDKVIYFNDLDSKAIRKIVEANLEKRGLPFSTKTVDKIISLSEYEKFGARKVEKIIDEEYSLNKVKQ